MKHRNILDAAGALAKRSANREEGLSRSSAELQPPPWRGRRFLLSGPRRALVGQALEMVVDLGLRPADAIGANADRLRKLATADEPHQMDT
jgi:hypothetical protein